MQREMHTYRILYIPLIAIINKLMKYLRYILL